MKKDRVELLSKIIHKHIDNMALELIDNSYNGLIDIKYKEDGKPICGGFHCLESYAKIIDSNNII